ncbi:MAG TPA: hydroxyisourate hydrolase [Puia sp.]|jgi:5-hydroxyisourate hydrolase|nr:hydroxyisourate hydrolase [Puia sp.]
MSKITTHILDTAKGRPAEGVSVTLYRVEGLAPAVETAIAGGRTNKDGRIADWQEAGRAGSEATGVDAGGKPMQTDAGFYKIRFETRAYFEGIATFYPFVDIYFEVTGDGHYHIPLLISPFGYSTYRGS